MMLFFSRDKQGDQSGMDLNTENPKRDCLLGLRNAAKDLLPGYELTFQQGKNPKYVARTTNESFRSNQIHLLEHNGID